jgi:putative endonuclease
MRSRAERGRSGEEATLALYRLRGFDEVARNWRCKVGEVDLIVRRGDLLVFCEVKTRAGSSFGGGYEAVTWKKRDKLRQLAELFLLSSGEPHDEIRFDVASVSAPSGHEPRVELFEDAF